MNGKLLFAICLIIVPIGNVVSAKASSGLSLDVKVGCYYYVWYGDGLGSSHWNNSGNIVVDTPTIGFYGSQSYDVINRQLDEMKYAGIDFVIVSWWGINSYTDNSNKILFEALKQNSSIQALVMVEPFNQSSGEYNFPAIYNYIYSSYVSVYPEQYMTLYGKPLVCFYNDANLTRDGTIGLDSRFESRIVGHQNYTNWVYWSFDNNDSQPWTAGTQPLCIDGEINVCPRYDDYYQRVPYCRFDVSYSEGLYDKQWSKVISLARQGKVNIVTISTWNEYHERTQIEPHNDTTAYDSDPYFLYDKTRKYITALRGSFVDFVEEIFQDVSGLGENQYRYNAVDSCGARLDTIKIIENPYGGYLGIYHNGSAGNFEVRLANSTDLLNWTFMGIIEENASQPTIAEAPNGAFIVAFEKHIDGNHSLGFHYYSNLTSLLEFTFELNFTVPCTLGSSSGLEGTPNLYNITITEPELLRACVGFHFNNSTEDSLGLDRVAVGSLNIGLNPPSYQSWEVKTIEQYDKKLEQMDVKGHIGDRDYGRVSGRDFTLQEASLLPPNESLHWASWRIFLYDHSWGSFRMLKIATHFNATSFGNPTFTFLAKSPNNKSCVVCTYFLFSEGLASEYQNKSGELIFYKEFETEQFPTNASYFIDVTTNSTISSFSFNETEKSISFNVTGPDDSKGFCIAAIPRDVAEDLWQSNFTVFFDGEQWTSFESWTCAENTYIYINYIHSEHQILIIPEFSSFLILPLLMTATLLAIIVFRRKHTLDNSAVHLSEMSNPSM